MVRQHRFRPRDRERELGYKLSVDIRCTETLHTDL